MTHNKLPELTVRSVLLGVILSILLAGANAYLGLFAGMTISASIPAAVVSMGILKLLRKSNVLENNIVQTAASAGESLAAGVIFTFPALVLMDYWQEFDFLWVTAIAALGGLLGALFTIPLRRAMIVEEPMAFPEGVATAEVLTSGHAAGGGVWYIVQGGLLGGLFKIGQEALNLWNGLFEGAMRLGGTLGYGGANLSPALLSVGYIVGLNIAVLIFLGGVLNWWVAIPLCASLETPPEANMSALDWAYHIWSSKTRYIGVGGMIAGGLWTIVSLRSSVLAGIRSGLKVRRHADGQRPDRTQQDIPTRWVLVLIIASVVPLFLLYQRFVGDLSVSIPMAVIMLGTGFLFSAVAAYMAGLVGSSNTPISGVTIATVLVSGLLLAALMGRHSAVGPAAAVIIGSVVCCAAAIAGDTMQDLKAGYLVGATPWKQQLMEMVGTLAVAFVMAPILTLLLKAYGFAGHASAKAGALAAVQANLVRSIADGVFAGTLPWTYIAIGFGLAAVVIAVDARLAAFGSGFRIPVLAVAIGIYLPFHLAAPIFAGGLLREAVCRYRLRRGLVPEPSNGGLLFASGLITGEAMAGILIAIPIVITGSKHAMAILEEPLGVWPAAILLSAIAFQLARSAAADTTKS